MSEGTEMMGAGTDNVDRQTSIKIESRSNPMLSQDGASDTSENEPEQEPPQRKSLHQQASERLSKLEMKKPCTKRMKEKYVTIAGPKVVGSNADLMPENCVCILVLIVNLIGLACFCYLTWEYYQQELKRPFLSAVKQDDSTTCSVIENMVDETFRLDDDGHWSTQSAFSFRKSILEVQFRAYERTNRMYKSNMTSLYKELKQLNTELESTPMDRAIVTLATMRRPVQNDKNQYDKNLLLLPDVSPPRIMETPYKEITLYKGKATGPTPVPTPVPTVVPTTSPKPTTETDDDKTDDDKTDDDWTDDNCGEVGLDGNLCDLTFEIVETDRYVWLQTKLDWLQCCYPNFKTSSTLDTGDGDMVTLKINRYSLFVAAAVNMGILNTTSLTSTNYDYRDDDAPDYDDEQGDDYAYYYDDGDDGGNHDEDRRRRLTDDDQWDDEHYNYTDWTDTSDFISKRFVEEMDPIQCTRITGVQDRCWIQTNENEDNTEGLVLFPVIQAEDYKCRECGIGSCSDYFELNYVLLFDGSEPEKAANVDYSAENDYACYFVDYCDAPGGDDDMEVDSAIMFKHTGSIDFLNDHFYNKPVYTGSKSGNETFHCNKDGFFNITNQPGSALECGNSQASDSKFCNKPPIGLQESYYTCTLKPMPALQKAIAAAYGLLASIMAVVSPTIIVIMGKIYAKRMIEQKVKNEIDDARRIAELIEKRPWETKKGQ